MKTNILVMKRKLVCRFNFVFVLLCIFSLNGLGQKIKKTFVKEIEVNNGITVFSNVPTDILLEMHTHYSQTNNTFDGFIIQGKENRTRLKLHKDYVIKNWDKQTVRQEVEVTLRCANEKATQALLDQFKIEFSQNQNGDVNVDGNMNLVKFTMRNSRFGGDKCKIILEGGKEYDIEYLELKTKLYLPKTANLSVHAFNNHTLRLDDFYGNLDLDTQYGEVFGKKIKNLNANLRFCYNVIFEEADQVIASATQSHLKIDKVKFLHIGKNKLGEEPYVNEHYNEWLANNSSMNLYNFEDVDNMIITDTANDDFSIGTVDYLEIKKSVFSEYKILRLNEKLKLNSKSGDLLIADVHKDFKQIDLVNSRSKMTLNISDEANYKINIEDKSTIDYKFPPNSQLLVDTKNGNISVKVGKGKSTGEINIDCKKCELEIW